VGGEEDEAGNQLKPDDISTFKIPAGTALHLKTGLPWLHRSRALLLGVGYGVPFGRYKGEVTRNRSASRRRTADLFTPGRVRGGLHVPVLLRRHACKINAATEKEPVGCA
jgi:hypothetical protein